MQHRAAFLQSTAGMEVSTEALFERFREHGDARAFAEVYDRTAGEVLRVALALARGPAAAEDLVQVTYLAAIEGAAGFDPARRVLPWLLGILANQARWQRRREARTPDPARLAPQSPSDPVGSAQRAEFTRQVDDAIAQLPELYRPVLVLHLKHGLASADIAHALARPPSTVRTQLVRGLELLRGALPKGLAIGAIAWALAPRGLAQVRRIVLAKAGGGGIAWGLGSLLGGVLVMKKLVAGVAAAVLVVLGWVAFTTADAGSSALNPGLGATAAAPTTPTAPAPHPGEAVAAVTRAEIAPPADAGDVARACLRVRVVWDSDGAPAADIQATVFVWQRANPETSGTTLRTDAAGIVTFDRLEPGGVIVTLDRAEGGQWTLAAGEQREVTVRIPRGIQLTVRVVDESEQPVADAEVWLSESGSTNQGRVVGRTDALGETFLRDVDNARHVAARGAGRVATSTYPLHGGPGESITRVLRLPRGGGALHGIVLDHDRKPLPQARVVVWPLVFVGGTDTSGFVPPQVLATDAFGRFHAVGLSLGNTTVSARAPGCACQARWVQVLENEDLAVEIVLEPEVSLTGRVTDAAGQPLAGISVTVGERRSQDDTHCSSRTGTDGSYRMREVGAGQKAVRAARAGERAEVQVELAVDRENRVDLVLRPPSPTGGVITGVVLDEDGQPLAQWRVGGQSYFGMGDWLAGTATDATGRFRLANCPDQAVRVDVHAPGCESFTNFSVHDVRCGKGELRIVVPREAILLAAIRLQLVDETGRALAGVAVAVTRLPGNVSRILRSDAAGLVVQAGLPAGTYRVVAKAEGRMSAVLDVRQLTGGDVLDLGRVSLVAGRSLVARVVASDGSPAPMPWGRILDASGAEIATVPSQQTGRFELPPLAPGRYTALVVSRTDACTRFGFEVTAGDHPPLEWRLARGVLVAFELREGDSAARAHVFDLRILDGTGEIYGVQNHPRLKQGLGTGITLAAGDYRVEAVTDTGARGTIAFSVPAAGGPAPAPVIVPLR